MKRIHMALMAAMLSGSLAAHGLTVTGGSVGYWDETSIVEESDAYWEVRNRDEEQAGVDGERARLRFGYQESANQPKPHPKYRRNGMLYEGAGSNLAPTDSNDAQNDIAAWGITGGGGVVQIGTLHYYDNINGEERDTSITAAELDIDILVDGVGNIGRFTYGFGFEELPGSAHGKHRATWSLTTPDTLNFAYGGYWYDLQLVGFSETETLADFDPSSVFTEYQVPDLDEEDTKSNDDFYLYGNVTRRGPVGTSVPDGGTTVLLLGCGLGLIGLMKRHR